MTEKVEALKKIVSSLNSKELITIEVVGKCDEYGILKGNLNQTIKLNNDVDHRISLVSLETSNFLTNLNEKNSKFYYYSPKNRGDYTITFPNGAYEIEGYNKDLQLLLEANGEDKDCIVISLSNSSARCCIALKDGYKVYFNKANTWRDCLGFGNVVLDKNFNWSEKLVNVVPIQKVYVACDLCNGSVAFENTLYNACILYSFPNNRPYGIPLTERPTVLRERELRSKSINSLSLQFFSDDNQPIDFQGAQVTCELQIRQV